MSVWKEIQSSFKNGSTLTKLIYLNLAIFLFITLISIFDTLFRLGNVSGFLVTWMAVPSTIERLIIQPWSIITYMFLHEGFFHILFNILWLYWFGKLFLQYLDQKKLVGLYILGGISGALLYFISYNLFPGLGGNSFLLGASASVMAIVVAIAMYAPNQELYLMFLGPVKIKYIALGAFLITSVFDFSTNTGGKLAHIGGAIYGFFYGVEIKKGKDIARGFNNFLDSFFSLFKKRSRGRGKIKVTHKRAETDWEFNERKKSEQEELDIILDKIKRSGYDSLTKTEKETLFKMSNKN